MSNCLKVNLFYITQQLNEINILFSQVLTPIEYLEKYCRVDHRRYTLYKRVFDKHRDIEAILNMEVIFS